MATLPSTTTKTLTINSSSLFLESYQSYSTLSPQTTPPLSFNLLSQGSPLAPIPSDLPHSKVIPKSHFIVDGFRSAGDFSVSYFLSHFHSDHYAGLSPSWSRGIIFCSETTAPLLVEILAVPPLFVVSLSLGETVRIDGCDVTVVDANHCPGAVQFLFELHGAEGRQPERYVHTGDFRFCASMRSDPHLGRFVGADAVFLDTTYCNPKFVFPSQEESVEYVVSTIQRIRDQNKGLSESVLFLIATYVIGKERVLLEISRRCNCLLHVDSKKMRILSILGFGDHSIFTEDASASNIHVIGWNLLGETWPYFRPNFVKMKELMMERGYSKAVGFVSTGWMYETKRDGFAVRVKDSLEIHLVPYSEHSSYDELREYVRFLRPKRVIPTVGADVEKLGGKQVVAMQKHFVGLVDETANKAEFLMAFRPRVVGADARAGSDMENSTSKAEGVEEGDDRNLELLQSGQGLPLQGSNMLNDKDMEGAMKELHDCLPSWVSQDQILGLLRGSGGDIVVAVSEFFEHEIEFYEQANASNQCVSSTQANMHNDSASCPDLTCTQVNSDWGKPKLDQNKKSTGQSLVILSSNLPKKRGSGTGNKPKKKGRSSLPPETSGCKQSTITKFFGRLVSNSSCDDACGIMTGDQHLKDEKPLGDTVDKYKEELDQLLQIINGGMARDTAVSLLEKAKGNVDVAVDIYFGKSNRVSGNEGSSVSCSAEADMRDGPIENFTEKTSNLSEELTNSPSLFVQGTSLEDTTLINVSLPVEKYSPSEHACWKAGQPAPYLHLARTFDLVEREKGKIKTTIMLCNMFRSLLALSPDDVLPAVYLCTNKIAADHENMELNIGGSLVIAALEEACGTSRSKIKEMYKKSGDLGDVAQECRQTQSLLAPPRPLSIQNLFCMLRKISVETGSGSTARRKNVVVNLMRSCREMEMKFLVRMLIRNLRIGAMMRTILPALAQAVVLNYYSPMHQIGSSESLKLQLQGISAAVVEAFNIVPNLDLLIPSLLSNGIDFSASGLSLVPGTPIPPMLARITNGVIQVLKLFQSRAFTCEYKYDGQRAQIHRLVDGSVRVFSRNMKETTPRFPDLINIIKESCNPAILTFILDAEIVAVDRKNKRKLMSFQELSSREKGSKDYSVKMDSIKVDICIFLFDIMYFNGERLLASPLRQRRKYLKDLFRKEKLGYLEFANEITVEADEACLDNRSTLAKINSFFEDACNSSCEGIMAKSLDIDGGYSASRRTEAWLKVKRDYVEGLGDSLDLVPIGAWHGNGRKAGWYSPFLMACYNPDAEEYQSVCRVMSGFSDSFYIEMKEFFSGERILCKKPPYYQTDESPDLWFSPELVWEIRGADFTISPVHHAAVGLVHPSRGISVRLPRHVRSVPDRKPEDCSTAADIACMFESQTRKMEVKSED